MSSILIAFYLIFYLILSLKRLDWAVMLILAALPAYQIRFSVFGYPSTLLEAMILIATVIWAARNCRRIINNAKARFRSLRNSSFDIRHSSFARYPFDLEIILMLLISWGAIIAAGVTSEALGVWKAYFYEPALVFILVMNVFKFDTNPATLLSLRGAQRRSNPGASEIDAGLPRNDMGKILWPLAISALVVSLIAVFQKLTGLFAVEAFWPRVTGPFPYPNALGLYLGPIILIMAGWLFHLLSFRAPSGLGARNPLKNETGAADEFNNNGQKIRFQLFSKIIASFKGFLARLGGLRNDKIKTVFILVSIVFSLAAIFFARSEGALVGVAFALLFFFGFAVAPEIVKNPAMMKIGYFKIFIISALALAFPLIALKAVPAHYYPNFDNKLIDYALNKAMLKDLSGEIRKQQWRETWEMMTESPARFIFGTGLSGYQAAIAPYHQEGIFFNREQDPDFRRKIVLFDEKYKAAHWQPVEIYMYPHSLVLNFWTELGLAGALLFIWIIGKFLYLAAKSYKLKATSYEKYPPEFLGLGLLGAMLVIIVHGIVDVPYFKNDLAVAFWVLIAMAGILRLAAKGENTES